MSLHFQPSEFACPCCGAIPDVMPLFALMSTLEWLRGACGGSIKVNSAYRCAKHNAEVGGKPDSYHLKGMACDIVVSMHTPNEVLKVIDSDAKACRLGVGTYQNFTHIDLGPTRRWVG